MTENWYLYTGIVLAVILALAATFILPYLARKARYPGDIFGFGALGAGIGAFALVFLWPVVLPLGVLAGVSYLFYKWLDKREEANKKVEWDISAARKKRDELRKLQKEIKETEGWLKANVENGNDFK